VDILENGWFLKKFFLLGFGAGNDLKIEKDTWFTILNF
jgi:hypothetical protein